MIGETKDNLDLIVSLHLGRFWAVKGQSKGRTLYRVHLCVTFWMEKQKTHKNIRYFKQIPDVFLGPSGDTELFEKSNNINCFWTIRYNKLRKLE